MVNRLLFQDYNGVSAYSHGTFRLFSFLSMQSNGPMLCERDCIVGVGFKTPTNISLPHTCQMFLCVVMS